MPTFEQIQFRQYKSTDNEKMRVLHRAALEAVGAFVEDEEMDSDLSDIEGVYIRNGGDFIVGVLDGEIVAMGALRRKSDTVVMLKRMRVEIGLQGQGIGRGMLAMLEARARDIGYDEIELDTTVKQEASRHLYETSGYIEVRREAVGCPLETIFYRKILS